MADNSTCDTRNISGRETHSSLGRLAITLLGMPKLAVNELDYLFKACKLALRTVSAFLTYS